MHLCVLVYMSTRMHECTCAYAGVSVYVSAWVSLLHLSAERPQNPVFEPGIWTLALKHFSLRQPELQQEMADFRVGARKVQN
jgi:hypothetical protein